MMSYSLKIYKMISQLLELFFFYTPTQRSFFARSMAECLFLLRYYYTVTNMKKEIHRMTNCRIAFTVCHYNIIHHTRERV